MQRPVVVLFAVLLFLHQSTRAQTTYTHAELTKENTSACSQIDPSPMCYAPFKQMMDIAGFGFVPGTSTQYRAITPFYNIAPGNVSGPAEGNVHPRSIRELIPFSPASDTLVMAHFMPWFYQDSLDHVRVGYTSKTVSLITRQLDDIHARGIDGVIVDWYGGQSNCLTEEDVDNDVFIFSTGCPQARRDIDLTTASILANVTQNTATRPLKFALTLDQGSYDSPALCFQQSYYLTGKMAKCIQSKIEADLHYAAQQYFGYNDANSRYAKHLSRPIVFAFLTENATIPINTPSESGDMQIFSNCNTILGGCDLPHTTTTCTGPNDCWRKIWYGALQHFASDNSHPYEPVMVFQNSGYEPTSGYNFFNGVRHIKSEGMFAWVQPGVAGQSNITDATQRQFGSQYLLDFYSEATCTVSGGQCAILDPETQNRDADDEPRDTVGMLSVGSVYKGFDDYLAFKPGVFDTSSQTYPETRDPNKHRVMSQRCGATWLDSWEHIKKPDVNTVGGNLDIIQLATWNDYDEGTAIEPGIEHCFAVNGGGVVNQNWQITFSLYTTGGEALTDSGAIRAIDHFEIFYQSAEPELSGNLYLLADHVPVNYSSVYLQGSSCPTCKSYMFQYDVSSFLASQPPDLGWNFYVKAIGEPGFVNKIGTAITSYLPGRPNRPARDPYAPPPGQNAFMDSVPPIPPPPPPEEPPPPPPEEYNCTNPDPNLPPMVCEMPS